MSFTATKILSIRAKCCFALGFTATLAIASLRSFSVRRYTAVATFNSLQLGLFFDSVATAALFS